MEPWWGKKKNYAKFEDCTCELNQELCVCMCVVYVLGVVVGGCLSEHVCMYACVRWCACVRACVHVCVHVNMCMVAVMSNVKDDKLPKKSLVIVFLSFFLIIVM